MTDHPTTRFPAACRQFLIELDEFATAELPAVAAAHLTECLSCAHRLRAARENAVLLRDLDSPEIPAEVRSPEMLSRIYERSTERSERQHGDVLRAALGPVRAPGDAVWLDSDHSALEPSLRAVFTRANSPGWMWRRIRAALAEDEPKPRNRRVMLQRVGLAAAALLICSLLLVENPLGTTATKQGTSPLITVVFETISEPFEPAFSLGSLAEAGRY